MKNYKLGLVDTDDEILYVLMEVKQETNYVLHHAQKILAIFAAMRDFKSMLAKKNHQVIIVNTTIKLFKQSSNSQAII